MFADVKCDTGFETFLPVVVVCLQTIFLIHCDSHSRWFKISQRYLLILEVKTYFSSFTKNDVTLGEAKVFHT